MPPPIASGKHVDLRLASSYLPAILCAVKSMAMATLAGALLPLGGGPALALLVAVDRLYWNTDVVFDVNAVVAFVLGMCAVMHERLLKGTRSATALVPLCVWVSVGLIQMAWRIAPSLLFSLSPKWELSIACTMAVVVSMTHQDRDPIPIAMCRVGVMVIAVMGCSYTVAFTPAHRATPQPLLCLLMRVGPIMLAPALAGFGYALILIGIIAMGVWPPTLLSRYGTPQMPTSDDDDFVIGVSAPSEPTTREDEETSAEDDRGSAEAILREALGRRKGTRSC